MVQFAQESKVKAKENNHLVVFLTFCLHPLITWFHDTRMLGMQGLKENLRKC
jgi:hypothetical protein